MAVYKVSYVVRGGDHPGGIANLDHAPSIGERVRFGDTVLEVIEIVDLMPPRGQFYYLHATCKIVQENISSP